MRTMQAPPKFLTVTALIVACLCNAFSQDRPQHKTGSHAVLKSATESRSRTPSRALSDDDRLSLIAAALDARVRSGEPDCSHLVHAVYEQAGFTYPYVPSSDLYAGVDGFQRVTKPEPGDLVVWRGHVGIVIKPSQHIFFSYLSSGPGIDDYRSPYWKHRGRPRFYRYVKSFGPQPSPQFVRAKNVPRTASDPTVDDGQ
jgi:cell wall-associated NlpC family hydrolase